MSLYLFTLCGPQTSKCLVLRRVCSSLKGVSRGACQVSNDDGINSLMRTHWRPHTVPTVLSVNNQIKKSPGVCACILPQCCQPLVLVVKVNGSHVEGLGPSPYAWRKDALCNLVERGSNSSYCRRFWGMTTTQCLQHLVNKVKVEEVLAVDLELHPDCQEKKGCPDHGGRKHMPR